jgi:hypothetical protein
MSIICEGMKRVVRRLTYINAPAIDDDQIRKFHHTDANSVLEALPGSKFFVRIRCHKKVWLTM